MYHGYTNCPRQYEKLAKQFFDKGYNVYVPRIPYHGYNDLMAREIGRLTLDDLMRVADASVDIGQGLGENVTVLGLSMGGVMSSWVAQFRPEVDTAVVIVPSFAWHLLPRVIKPLVNLSYAMPDLRLWWDPVKKDKRVAPFSMYYKFSSRGMGHVLRLGLSVIRASRLAPPAAKRIIVLTNELDVAVDENTTQNLVEHWKLHGAKVGTYMFPKDLNMEHDVIDPLQPYDQTDVVYKKIFDMLENDCGCEE
jgi:esterase/lipase